MRFSRIPRGITLFTVAYLLAAAVGVVVTGNWEFVFYLAVMLILIPAVLMVHARVELSVASLWCLSIWGGLHMAGGLMPVADAWPVHGENRVLYSLWLIPGWLKYDQVVHAYGFGITTWVCFQGLSALSTGFRASPEPTLGRLVLCGAAGFGFGALNEVVEFFAVLLVPKTNVGDYFNTGWDLVSNLVGVVIACCVLRVVSGRKKKAGALL